MLFLPYKGNKNFVSEQKNINRKFVTIYFKPLVGCQGPFTKYVKLFLKAFFKKRVLVLRCVFDQLRHFCPTFKIPAIHTIEYIGAIFSAVRSAYFMNDPLWQNFDFHTFHNYQMLVASLHFLLCVCVVCARII